MTSGWTMAATKSSTRLAASRRRRARLGPRRRSRIGGIVQAHADPDGHQQKGGDEKHLHVGHAIEHGKGNKGEKGQAGQDQGFGSSGWRSWPGDGEAGRGRPAGQGQPHRPELLPEQLGVKGRHPGRGPGGCRPERRVATGGHPLPETAQGIGIGTVQRAHVPPQGKVEVEQERDKAS